MTGLDPDAYLNAEALYRKTGDLRYLVLVVGKPRATSYSDDPLEVPEWALAECREYAARIMRATASQRRKIKTSFVDPIPQDTVRDSFVDAMDVFLDLSASDGKLERPTLAEAARRAEGQKAQTERREPVEDPDQVRKFRRLLTEEAREMRPGEDSEPPWARRSEEKSMNRVARRRRGRS